METFKAYILILGFIGALGFGGYWAATSFKEPIRVVDTNTINVVAQAPSDSFLVDNSNEISFNEGISEEITSPDDNVVIPDSSDSASTQGVENNISQSTSSENTSLIQSLQRLIDDGVVMREGSRGTRVGVVQNFLNTYNNTTTRVDNDYGPGTKNRVQQFQRDQGLNSDGQTGPNTYRKMIEWLQSN